MFNLFKQKEDERTAKTIPEFYFVHDFYEAVRRSGYDRNGFELDQLPILRAYRAVRALAISAKIDYREVFTMLDTASRGEAQDENS